MNAFIRSLKSWLQLSRILSILNRFPYNFIYYQHYANTDQPVRYLYCSVKKEHYLIVGFNLPDENREVLDTQRGVIVDFLVGPLYGGLWISGKKK